jgi:predicted esterase
LEENKEEVEKSRYTVKEIDGTEPKKGYSNGANIAASMLLLRPEILSSAILFRAMVPLVPQTLPNLSDKHIFMSSGLHDPVVSRQETDSLFGLFKKSRIQYYTKLARERP